MILFLQSMIQEVPVPDAAQWWTAFAPGAVLLLGILVLIVAELAWDYLGTREGNWLVPFTASGFTLWAMWETIAAWDTGASLPAADSSYPPVLVADNLTLLFTLLLLFILLLTVIMSHVFNIRQRIYEIEYYPLLFLSVMGMITLVYSRDLIVTFISIELLSIPLYVLVGLNEDYWESSEASLKYFLLGAFASGFLLYGVALIYGSFGTLNYTEMAGGPFAPNGETFLLAGLALVLIGFAFKIALIPFHTWVPDVYQGSPPTITGFMATAVKAAMFGALIIFFGQYMEPHMDLWIYPLAGLGALTMVLGNFMALPQKSLKRLLAYSSVVHAGYLTVGLVVNTPQAWSYLWFYLVAYAFAVLGSFHIISYLSPEGEGDVTLDDVQGLAYKNPWAGYAFTLFMISLAGLPISMGFFGKLFLFVEAVQQGWLWFVIVALLASVVSVYYYLKVIVAMFMQEQVKETEPFRKASPSPWYGVVWAVTIAGTLIFGAYPSPLLRVTREAMRTLPF